MSPTEGATIKERSSVHIHYAGYSTGARNISGYLTLDGVPAGTFTRPVNGTPTNGTTFNVTLNATAFASGAHALGAHVYTELDAAVDAPTVAIALDKPPTIASLAWSYDLDTRELVVDTQIVDDGAAAPTVRLVSGAQSLNDSYVGAKTLRLGAPRTPGTYWASLTVIDAFNQTAHRNFNYSVADREANLSVTEAVYELGGKLRTRGTVVDPDGGISSVLVNTSLGSGIATVANGSWSARFNVTPTLGTFQGTAISTDVWGGTTSAAFTFTIGGPNETVFFRSVTTELGEYADRAAIPIPALLGGTITICVDGCEATNASTNPAFDATCGGASWNGPLCRQLTGRPGLPGALDVCAPAPIPNNLFAQLAWTAARTANNATGGRVCSSAFDHVNETSDASGLNTFAPDAPSVLIVPLLGGAGANSTIRCIAVSDRECGFSAPQGATLDLSWVQGPMHTVTVRVSGIRV